MTLIMYLKQPEYKQYQLLLKNINNFDLAQSINLKFKKITLKEI